MQPVTTLMIETFPRYQLGEAGQGRKLGKWAGGSQVLVPFRHGQRRGAGGAYDAPVCVRAKRQVCRERSFQKQVLSIDVVFFFPFGVCWLYRNDVGTPRPDSSSSLEGVFLFFLFCAAALLRCGQASGVKAVNCPVVMIALRSLSRSLSLSLSPSLSTFIPPYVSRVPCPLSPVPDPDGVCCCCSPWCRRGT